MKKEISLLYNLCNAKLLFSDFCGKKVAEITGRNPNRYKILPGELCAGAELGKDSCYGEGGFPLVCQSEEDKWHAVGIGKYKQNTVKLPLRPAGTKKLEGFLETVLLHK